jgi:hypothetical protein
VVRELQQLSSQAPGTSSQPAATQSFESYGKLLTLLLPRMRNFAVHDGFSNPVWTTPDWNVDIASDFVRETIAAALQDQVEIPAQGCAIDNDRALYSFALRNDCHEVLAVVSLEVSIPANQRGPRPVDALRPFVQPAIECLRRELVLRDAALSGERRDAPRAQVVPLPVAPVNDLDALDAILRHGFHHVGCALAALWVPERNVSISLTQSGKRMPAQLLRLPQQQLLLAMQKNPRTIILNQTMASEPNGTASTAYKILACPVTGPAGRLVGVMALFNPPSVADFEAPQARSAELLANCLGVLVDRGRAAQAGNAAPGNQVRNAG